MSNADTVSYWFSDTISTGPISRNAAAHAEALEAKDDLVARLDAAKGTPAEIVDAWFAERVACGGALARDTAAYNQAFTAKADLIARLAALWQEPAPAPAPASTKAPKNPPSPLTETPSEN